MGDAHTQTHRHAHTNLHTCTQTWTHRHTGTKCALVIFTCRPHHSVAIFHLPFTHRHRAMFTHTHTHAHTHTSHTYINTPPIQSVFFPTGYTSQNEWLVLLTEVKHGVHISHRGNHMLTAAEG